MKQGAWSCADIGQRAGESYWCLLVRMRYKNVAVNAGEGCIRSRTRIFGDNSAFTPEPRKLRKTLIDLDGCRTFQKHTNF
jgi:hypothetical protein